MWCCGKITILGRRRLSTGPVTPSRSMTARAASSRRPRSSSPCSAPAPTPLHERRPARIWRIGSTAMCAPLSFSRASPNCSCRTTRTGVTRACRYEPDLNRTYHEMAQYYSIAVLPARPYKPRDKAKVENAVGIVERWILAALRHRKFFAIADLNEAIEELLESLNNRRFRKRDGTRASLFAQVDRPALQPLPAERYVMAEWKTVRANIDYHIEIDRHYYSVPYQLAGQQLEARYTATTVELFQDGKRVASHARSSASYRHTTVHEHMPKSHQAHLEWTPSRLIHWGETVGTATAEVIRTILASKPHPEMGYRACLGILRLAKTYSQERLEAASQRALQLQACSYSSLRSILKRSLDRQTTLELESGKPGPRHENVRGAGYYDPPTTLLQ